MIDQKSVFEYKLFDEVADEIQRAKIDLRVQWIAVKEGKEQTRKADLNKTSHASSS